MADRHPADVALIEGLALVLGCLPSTFPDANEHILGAARTLADRVRDLAGRARIGALCDVCCGTGKPASGLPCGCGGTGLMSETVAELRRLAIVEQPERIRKLEDQLAAAPHECHAVLPGDPSTCPRDDCNDCPAAVSGEEGSLAVKQKVRRLKEELYDYPECGGFQFDRLLEILAELDARLERLEGKDAAQDQ